MTLTAPYDAHRVTLTAPYDVYLTLRLTCRIAIIVLARKAALILTSVYLTLDAP